METLRSGRRQARRNIRSSRVKRTTFLQFTSMSEPDINLISITTSKTPYATLYEG